MIGAGGGFLIIPALVILANIDMKVAVGTSLVIIAFKSLLGFFLGDALNDGYRLGIPCCFYRNLFSWYLYR